MKTPFILVSILFFAGIWYYCSEPARQNKQHHTPPKPPDKVELLNLNIGEEYIVKLPDRSTAGYSWFFEVNRDWIISIKELDADLEPSQGQRNQDSSLAPPRCAPGSPVRCKRDQGGGSAAAILPDKALGNPTETRHGKVFQSISGKWLINPVVIPIPELDTVPALVRRTCVRSDQTGTVSGLFASCAPRAHPCPFLSE